MPTDELRARLEEFTAFAAMIKGDEKSEAQIFLDHFFRALGHEGAQEAGAVFEFRIAKKPGSSRRSCSPATRRRPSRSRRAARSSPTSSGRAKSKEANSSKRNLI
jgi:hypothetical protein